MKENEFEIELPAWTDDLNALSVDHINVSIDGSKGKHLDKIRFNKMPIGFQG